MEGLSRLKWRLTRHVRLSGRHALSRLLSPAVSRFWRAPLCPAISGPRPGAALAPISRDGWIGRIGPLNLIAAETSSCCPALIGTRAGRTLRGLVDLVGVWCGTKLSSPSCSIPTTTTCSSLPLPDWAKRAGMFPQPRQCGLIPVAGMQSRTGHQGRDSSRDRAIAANRLALTVHRSSVSRLIMLISMYFTVPAWSPHSSSSMIGGSQTAPHPDQVYEASKGPSGACPYEGWATERM